MSTDYSNLPLREFPPGRLTARKEHLLAEITRERPGFSFLRFLPLRHPRTVLALVGALVVIGTAAAATSTWLTGSPAPPAVVSDFQSYNQQLGFHPQPGHAVLVAEDGDVALYATTNDEGSYCLVTSAPWKRPETLPDGGTCIPPTHAGAPLTAGLVGLASPATGAGQWTFLIAGRTDHPRAYEIEFTDPAGKAITRAVGSSGFFVASVQTSDPPCRRGDWKPNFIVRGSSGEKLVQGAITLATGRNGVCQFAAPHR